ncbi:MAG: phosphoglucosamine mutase [Oscillospiraceae bacterium]|nr:phosphoglucosamine mutase [Oscillospiraceae bacterium]MBR4101659.1 phosphoglucosamine mutase [Oscillospiraceae bacterium]MBR6618181.1 phosphoglucosamine mutase [Oscillospiraceae bacterium]
MGRLFGTDGARGIAITELTCELAMQIGRAAANVLTKHSSHRPKILIGKDTRISSDILEAALCAGICSVGADAEILGVVPTPAVAYLVRKCEADAGVMISASHNSVEFNGIKLFSSTGYKLSDEIEAEIEALILDTPEKMQLVSGTDVGKISYYENAAQDYISYVESSIQTKPEGLRVAIDCANGSSSATAQELFTRLGAEVLLIHAQPDGTNINENCGSTHMEDLMQFVVENHCDIGLAFDGDADRCLAVDETGEMVDGDKLIAIAAKAYQEQGRLKQNAVVVTVMSNLGFTYFAKAQNIKMITANVGDRYVLEKMLDGGYNIGGEQSGHIIFLDEMTTGDGQLSGAKILEILKSSGKKMSELAGVMEKFPQVMVNVKIPNHRKENWKNDSEITDLIDRKETELGDAGRILVRESGTEPLIRVMIEGKDFNQINAMAMEISEKIRERAGR